MEFIKENDELLDEAAFLELLANDLIPFYEPRLPYHNWDEHIVNGIGIVDNLCQQELAEGKPINPFMARVAYMAHDAGFPHDLITPDIWEPYGSKEGYSAHIIGVLLRSYEMDEDFISGVQTCIMFTKMNEKLPEGISKELANTAEAVRTADLSNVFGPYKGFVENSFKLMEEGRIYGKTPNLQEFKKVTRFVLGNYLGYGFVSAGTCKLVDGIRNIERFSKDSPSRLLKAVGAQASRFAGLVKKDAA